MTVHGGIYVQDPYLLRAIAQPRDELVQRGEVVSLWDVQPGETIQAWGCPWHVSNPTVLRFVMPGVSCAQVDWIMGQWAVPDERGSDRLIAARLWRFDIDAILAEEAAVLGRPIDPQSDVIVVDAARRARWVQRRAEDGSGMMWNKSAGDIPLNDPSRVVG